jgi:recombinational DNA repair protein RecT
MPPTTRNDRAGRAAEARKAREEASAAVVPAVDTATGEIVRVDPLRQLLDGWKSEIVDQMPLQMKVNPDAFMRLILTGMRTSKQAVALAKCTRPSLFAALLEAARFGLTPFTEEAAIVPYGTEATFIPMAGGFVKMFWNTGQINGVVVDFIRVGEVRGEDWDVTRGAGTGFWHRPPLLTGDDGQLLRPGEPIMAYCYLKLKDGSITEPSLVPRWDAEDVMTTKSKAWANAERTGKKDSLWHTDFLSMWRKTAVRRVAKYGPKGLAVDTPIPTPSGWTTMGALAVGDMVLDRYGQPARVTVCSEVKHLPCYRLTFRDGDSITCDDEHRWVARLGWEREKTHTIGEMHAAKLAGRRVVIPLAGPLDLPPADVPADPWMLGYWLGNGKLDGYSVTANGDDAGDVTTAIRSRGYSVGAITPYPGRNATAIGVSGLAKPLAALGLLGVKSGGRFIPPAYLRGSRGQRLALLRGLMDSDGTTSGGRAKFVSTSRQLRDGVLELARSLGEKPQVREYDAHGYGLTIRAYEVRWLPGIAPFSVSRKVAAGRLAVQGRSHEVQAIEEVPSVPTRCITVDSYTRTYLAGRRMVPTHNSAELQELLLIEAREDVTRTDGMPVVPRQPPAAPAGDGAGIDWSTDIAGGKIAAGEVIREDGFPAGSTPARNGNGAAAGPGPGEQTAPADPGPAEAKAAGEAAGRKWPDVPLDEAVCKPTAGQMSSWWTKANLTGDDNRARRLALVNVLGAGQGAPLTLTSPAQLTERQARTAIVALEALAAAAGEAGEPLAVRMSRLYDAVTSQAKQAG